MRSFRWITVLLTSLIALSGCGVSKQVEETWTMVREKAAVFPDGAAVDLWRSDFGGRDVYKLADETTLLTVQDPMGPARVQVSGTEGFDDLGEAAQKAVLAYYEQQGLLYDVQAELKRAYESYSACQEMKLEFNSFFVSQEILPTASSDSVICFLTSVTLPVDGQETQEIRLGTLFDKKTGETVDPWTLFTLPEKEAAKKLLVLSQITDAELLAEMEAALKPEYMVLFPYFLEITFPRGTLPSQELPYVVEVDVDALRDVLHPWAIPHAA